MSRSAPFTIQSSTMQTTRRVALSALAGAAVTRAAAPKATAFALIGDRFHNSDYIRTGLTRTLTNQSGLSIDFTDETKLLNADTLSGYKMLIILRDGMNWPDGYPDETTNAAWVATGKPKLNFDPPVPQTAAKPAFWMKPEQGKAVRSFVENGGAGPVLAQRHARRRHRSRFPPRPGRSLHRPPSDPHFQGQGDEPQSPHYKRR